MKLEQVTMSSNAIIFIESCEGDNSNNNKSGILNKLFLISPKTLFERVLASFIPPILKRYKTVYIDLLGPIFALLIIAAILTYGTVYKNINVSISPTTALVLYSTFVPLLTFILCKLSQSNITLLEVTSLIGYSLYGHIVTLLISLLFYNENSNTFFFLCLILFSGFSTFRLIIVLLKVIPVAAMRFIVCSTIAVIQLLFLIFVHFAYMHRTFEYGRKNNF